jgi:galactokinase/mevalonate kinase-like predicted kinase
MTAEQKLQRELEILRSDEVQERIKQIKEKLGFIGRDITRSENYAIYDELINEGYQIQKYLEHEIESDKLIDKIVKESKNRDELINNLKKEGFLIIRRVAMTEEKKDVVWEERLTKRCPYCDDLIGGIGRGVKCKCGKTVLSGLLPEGFGYLSGGRDHNAK